MRLTLLVFSALFGFMLLSPPALAAAPADPGKKAEVPFREDSGLITAEYYLATGKYAQALEVLEGVLTRHPHCADAFTYKGFAYRKLGDVRKAKENYQKAIEINPAHLGANRYLAATYLEAGDLGRAFEQMQVIRMTCGAQNCQELDELEAEINAYRRGQSAAEPEEDAEEPRRKQGAYNR